MGPGFGKRGGGRSYMLKEISLVLFEQDVNSTIARLKSRRLAHSGLFWEKVEAGGSCGSCSCVYDRPQVWERLSLGRWRMGERVGSCNHAGSVSVAVLRIRFLSVLLNDMVHVRISFFILMLLKYSLQALDRIDLATATRNLDRVKFISIFRYCWLVLRFLIGLSTFRPFVISCSYWRSTSNATSFWEFDLKTTSWKFGK